MSSVNPDNSGDHMHIQERYTYMNRIQESFKEDRILKTTIGVWLGFVIISNLFKIHGWEETQ
ncbi:MAG: hypothetical protein ACXAD7_20510 [Candidatus Kariarchaeaceae archaeon]|jgi:hypothetical protein